MVLCDQINKINIRLQMNFLSLGTGSFIFIVIFLKIRGFERKSDVTSKNVLNVCINEWFK